MFFFSLASIWGFIVGVAGLLVAMNAAGQHIQADATVIFCLITGFIVAAGGGFVMAGAYRESKRRAR